MKRAAVVSLFLLTALALGTHSPVRGQSGFTIENADATNTLSFTDSTDLSDLIAQVAPRVIFQHARTNRYITLTPVPTTLSTLLAGVQPRIVFQHASANRNLALSPMPGPLNTLLDQIVARFVLQHVNASRTLSLAYPLELVDDNQAPRSSNLEVSPTDKTTAVVSWTTDEFADSVVRCGTQSGTYAMTFSDPLYVKAHAVTLTGLNVGTRYYCTVSSTDLSGNTYQSQEFTFEQVEASYIYLPLLLRSH